MLRQSMAAVAAMLSSRETGTMQAFNAVTSKKHRQKGIDQKTSVQGQALMCFVLLHQQWVADGSPTHSSSTPVKLESALQFVPPNTNPKEFKTVQKMVSLASLFVFPGEAVPFCPPFITW